MDSDPLNLPSSGSQDIYILEHPVVTLRNSTVQLSGLWKITALVRRRPQSITKCILCRKHFFYVLSGDVVFFKLWLTHEIQRNDDIQAKKNVDNNQLNSMPLYWVVQYYLYPVMRKSKQRKVREWDQWVELWEFAMWPQGESVSFYYFLEICIPELDKESKGIQNGILSTSPLSHYPFLLTILRRKHEKTGAGRWLVGRAPA